MAQPVLGILTLYTNEQKHLEERSIYQKMITLGKQIGLNVFVFTPQDVDESNRRINAMCYHPESDRWHYRWMKFPHMIFDRCRLQNSYRFEQLRKFRAKYNNLLFLNRPLRNKWTIHQVLSTLPSIRQHLPVTRLYTCVQDVQRMIKQEPLVYLKPINGTGGRGILRIERLKSSNQVVYVQGRDQQRRIIRPQKLTWSQLAIKLAAWNARERYLVQQGISLNLPNGRVHDYRMLVQKDRYGNWSLTGCAGRIGAEKSITSNLHGGGEAVAMDVLLNQWIADYLLIHRVKEEARTLGLEVASYLEEKYDALCEIALDIAIDRSGHVWMLEVNPKPAREVFNRIGDGDTYRAAIMRPLEYALWVYENKVLKNNNDGNLITYTSPFIADSDLLSIQMDSQIPIPDPATVTATTPTPTPAPALVPDLAPTPTSTPTHTITSIYEDGKILVYTSSYIVPQEYEEQGKSLQAVPCLETSE
ncbi:YheC/YheD family endospore coat-associated protein [Paenibacillus sp. 481]|uniref:YheC/YheD family endospore coat-associated protein n=1 Tax=Paenibacillus sp. 481 TaxID=2835869 RepID=UPI002FC3606C|nr:YheC/YheD family protein [Paenibacillus sp. 481]